MASACSFSEDLWESAFHAVKNQFEVESLMPEQQESIRMFMENRNIFVNLPTGYGKSLIYQCLPLVADILFERPRGSSVIVVISPLTSLMKDQVTKLNDLGIPAVAILDQDDPDLLQQIMNGTYIIVYCSPECMLATMTGRGILGDSTFKDMIIGVAVDEAHCITQWGLPGSKNSSAFRKWYGCLGELQSLIPASCKLIVLTATATKATKQQILDILHLSREDVTFIEQSPDKKNIFYCKEYLDKNEPLEDLFGSLIQELKNLNVKTERTLIYCQTRKQCSILYRMFEVYLGQGLYYQSVNPKNRIVEMFHAGTPTPVKDHVAVNLSKEEGHIRVLISTVAFGMGVDCKAVRRVVHFGPSRTIESYVQECGRAGRDGLPSTAVLLYNGLTSVICDADMKKVLQSEGCTRKDLMCHFDLEAESSAGRHDCCENCKKACTCGNCSVTWTPRKCDVPDVALLEKRIRLVNTQQKRELKEELLRFHRNNLRQVQVGNMVSCPNIVLEFNLFHINQVVENCKYLFTVKDILQFVEIWRLKYAFEVLRVVGLIFGDVDVDMRDDDEDVSELDDTMMSDWSQIRDDSTLMDMLDTQDLEGIECLMDSRASYSSSASNV